MKLFSYVVHHDTGFAPNPDDEFCTLVHCKFKGGKNVVDLAKEGDWIIGTGGKNKKLSCGRNDRVVYIMRVDKKLDFYDYLRDPRFRGRPDCKDCKEGNKFALVSRTFLYYGRKAIPTSRIPGTSLLTHPIEKKGPGFRSHFPEPFVRQLARWVLKQQRLGMIGEPCASGPRCSSNKTCRCRRTQ
jgi:hypothetical protein